MTRFLTVLLGVLMISCGIARSQYLHIYHIGVGHGDCTLLVVKDAKSASDATMVTKAILIDTGPIGKKYTTRMWNSINAYLGESGASQIDYFVVSHLHADHMRAALAFLKKMDPGKNKVTIIDRIYQGKKSGVYYPWPYRTKDIYKKYGTGSKQYMHKNIIPGETLLKLANFKMFCVAANGWIWNGTAAVNAINNAAPKDENDLSFAWMISFNRFQYFTGGDLPGTTVDHCNIESALNTALGGATPNPWHCCAFKLNHHGSATSTNDDFLALINPTIAVVPARRKSFGTSTDPLPDGSVIRRLQTNNIKVRYTYVPSPAPSPADEYNSTYFTKPKTKKGAIKTLRDIVIAVGRKKSDLTKELKFTPEVEMEIGSRDRTRKTMMQSGAWRYESIVPCTK